MSSAKKTITLWERRHLDALRDAIADWRIRAEEGRALAVTITETKRSLEQNALMWVVLAAWAKQIEWQVNGKAQRLTPEDWKDILTAAFLHEMGRIAPGLDGGMVLLGCRTRDFTVKEMKDFLDFIHASSAARGVVIAPATEDIEPEGYIREAS